MGYANNELSDNFKAVSAMFNGVGTVVDGQKGIYISQIEVIGADEFSGAKDNVVQIQFLKPNGSLDKAYGYHKGDTNRSFKNKGDGWYSAVPEPTSGLLLLLGVAGLAHTCSHFALQSSGYALG